MMDTVCNDNRYEIIAKAKKDLLDSTNIDTAEDEMKVIDNILFRCWQMGWLDRYDDTNLSGELFLTLNEAVGVAVNQFDIDPILARQEFEQKCYIPCSDYQKGFYDGLAKCRDIIEDAMSEGLDDGNM